MIISALCGAAEARRRSGSLIIKLNRTPEVLAASALDSAPEDRPKGNMALSHSSFQAPAFPEVAAFAEDFKPTPCAGYRASSNTSAQNHPRYILCKSNTVQAHRRWSL